MKSFVSSRTALRLTRTQNPIVRRAIATSPPFPPSQQKCYTTNTIIGNPVKPKLSLSEKDFHRRIHPIYADSLPKTGQQADNHEEGRRTEDTERMVDDPRIQILDTALRHVNDKGWTVDALTAAANDLSLPSVSHGMFSRGAIELVDYFMERSNQKMARELQKMQEEHPEGQRAKDILFHGIKTRLSCIIPYISSWPQAMALGAMPQNAVSTSTILGKLADELWHHAGDRSTNISWYTRRAVILGVYASTELFMLTDHSPNYQDTWRFLSQRLDEAEQLYDVPQNAQDVANAVGAGVRSVFSVTTSLAGPVLQQVVTRTPLVGVLSAVAQATSQPLRSAESFYDDVANGTGVTSQRDTPVQPWDSDERKKMRSAAGEHKAGKREKEEGSYTARKQSGTATNTIPMSPSTAV